MSNQAIFHVLGCGTSTGVPMIGCDCEVCQSSDPRNQRLRTSGLLELPDGRNLLIDASSDFRTQALRLGLRNLNAVLFTHAHADHSTGIEELRAFNFLHRNTIPAYATADTLAELRRRFYYIFEPQPGYVGGLVSQVELNQISFRQDLEVAGVQINVFPLWHGPQKIVGFRIGDLGYATDCNRVPPESREILQGVKTLLLDGIRYTPHNSHFTIDQAVEEAKVIGAEKTYLIHLTHEVDYAKGSALLPTGVELAYDRLKIGVRLS